MLRPITFGSFCRDYTPPGPQPAGKGEDKVTLDGTGAEGTTTAGKDQAVQTPIAQDPPMPPKGRNISLPVSPFCNE